MQTTSLSSSSSSLCHFPMDPIVSLSIWYLKCSIEQDGWFILRNVLLWKMNATQFWYKCAWFDVRKPHIAFQNVSWRATFQNQSFYNIEYSDEEPHRLRSAMKDLKFARSQTTHAGHVMFIFCVIAPVCRSARRAGRVEHSSTFLRTDRKKLWGWPHGVDHTHISKSMHNYREWFEVIFILTNVLDYIACQNNSCRLFWTCSLSKDLAYICTT